MREAKFRKSLTINISEEIFERIQSITDAERISISAWFRSAAAKALAKNEEEKE